MKISTRTKNVKAKKKIPLIHDFLITIIYDKNVEWKEPSAPKKTLRSTICCGHIIHSKPRIISLIIFIKMAKKFVFYMFLPNGNMKTLRVFKYFFFFCCFRE